MRVAIIVGSIIVAIIVLLIGYWYLYEFVSGYEPYTAIKKIYSQKYNETLYLKKKNWGVTGDYQIIIVTKTPGKIFEPNEKNDYVYKGLLSFFYEFHNDTLDIYTRRKSKIPESFDSKVVINQIEISNAEMSGLYTNYKSMGLNELQ